MVTSLFFQRYKRNRHRPETSGHRPVSTTEGQYAAQHFRRLGQMQKTHNGSKYVQQEEPVIWCNLYAHDPDRCTS